MPSERSQRRIERLLDQAEEAVDENEWELVAAKARAVLALEAEQPDALDLLRMAVANGVAEEAAPAAAPRQLVGANVSVEEPARSVIEAAAIVEAAHAAGTVIEDPAGAAADPTEFAGGRYQVLRFLGEGGKKRVFLAHDALLERDIAFSLIKTDGLDDVGRERITREAQAMGRLAHQNIVAIYDIGEHTAADGSKQPFLVQELMGGGDVEDLLADAGGPLSLAQALEIAIATARGLEFAHAQQVIHRDLKPGNVWLTADGVAKIGDLGLAVTLGQTRLTEHGMMVGTYGYMPPEQALGHEVTPQADLYSLGAMLYELVTGRPPFEGDTATAVISQHLNSQPVAPSWRSDHCPPDLEALILRLLAKAPADRPESASDVLAALEAVDPEGQSASHSDSGANPLDRLARGVFVGRGDELSQLRDGLDAALQGRGSVAMLVGEPGIGKTRTVQELETYARMRGANVYWGRTHESAGMPAYWPWLQVGRAWGAQQDFNAASAQGAVTNPEMVRLFPELRAQIPTLPEPVEHRDPESAQFLLFEAYTQFVRAQAAQTPWVIVLDDLHWADKPTLQLLQFMARELSNMPVLIVGTYRDTDLVRTHPLSEALAELNRGGGFRRVVLKGLDADEVASYVRQRASVEPSPALLDRVYEETEGNPFFLSEVVNLLVQEGTIDSESVSDIALPDGVREALGRRLDRLSPEANELLQVAAVVGREFAYETLALLDEERSDDALLGMLEDALGARVIEESDRAGRYRFTHALMQETLLEELATTRRVRLHGQIGDALERRWSGSPERAAENAAVLAGHYRESAAMTANHAVKARVYSALAGAQAADRSAWAEAARHYTAAVQAAEEQSPAVPGAELAALVEKLAEYLAAAGEWRSANREIMRARDLYSDAEDPVGFARTTALLSRLTLPPGRAAGLASQALERLGHWDPQLRVELLLLRSADGVSHESWDPDALREAANLARSHGLEALEVVAEWLSLRARVDAGATEESLSKHIALGDRLSRLGRDLEASLAKQRAVGHCIQLGQLDQGADLTDHTLEWQRTRGFVNQRGQALMSGANIALLRWDLDRYRAYADQFPPVNYWARLLPAQLQMLLGEVTDAWRELPDLTSVGKIPLYRANIFNLRLQLAMAGADERAARTELENWRSAVRDVPLAPRATESANAAEAAARFATEAECVEMLEWIEIRNVQRFSMWWPTSVDRARAVLYLRLGQVERAQQLAESAAALCVEQACFVEHGRCETVLAEVEERRGNVEAAREHLDAAGELFSRHGAKLYLDQVIAKKEILKA